MGNENDSVTNEFLNVLNRLRSEDVEALGEAARLQGSFQSLLQHEVQRIEKKLGTQHPRTGQLKARLQFSMQLAHSLELKRQLTRIDVPELPPEGALVHGRIVSEDGLGIAGLTVYLVDRSGTPVREARESTSDASGYFAIPLAPETVDQLGKRDPQGIFVAVYTPRQRPVHQEPRALALTRGTKLLVTIRISGIGLPAAMQGRT
jgi:hypothetical protein